MKIVLVISFLLLFAAMWGLEYESGSGVLVSDQCRETEARYHNGTDDRHFYYTYPEASNHLWAVQFDFRSYFADVDSLTFSPQSVHIYLPNQTISSNLNIGLHSNGANCPGEVITSESISASQLVAGWNEVAISAAADTLFWLVAGYTTGIGNQQYISASNGDGTHSYFWDPYAGEEGCWYNMSANGFNNEFLFTLEGEFHFTVPDLEISEFYLEGDFEPGSQIIPRAVLHNNYHSPQDSVKIVFKKDFPGDSRSDTLMIAQIGANEDILLPENNEISYITGNMPGIYRFTVTLTKSGDAVTTNNERIIYKNNFSIPKENILIENMMELDDNYSNSIWQAQSLAGDFTLTAINYFPSFQDEIYYNAEALARYNYYELYNLPATVISGTPLIGYINGEYESNFAEISENVMSGNTFVQITNIEALVDTLENVHVSVTLNRGQNQLLATFAANCHLLGMIYEENLPLSDQLSGKVFLDTIQFAQPALSGLANAEFRVKQTVFNQLFKFTPISEDLDNCVLLFWVQNIADNTVWATGELSFSDFGIVNSEQNEIIFPHKVFAYPNPYSGDGEIMLQIEGDIGRDDPAISVYNIKGQLVKHLANGSLSWNGRNSMNERVSDGIYFMQVKSGSSFYRTKVLLIR